MTRIHVRVNLKCPRRLHGRYDGHNGPGAIRAACPHCLRQSEIATAARALERQIAQAQNAITLERRNTTRTAGGGR